MIDLDDAPAVRPQPYRRHRTHHVVEHDGPPTMPHDAFGEVDPWAEHDERVAGVDPRLVRIGALAAVAVLMIPVALAVRDDGGGDLRTTTATVASTLPVVPAAPVTIPITAAAVAPSTAVVVRASEDDVEVATAVQAVAAPESPACAGTYTVVFNDYWNRFAASSGATVAEWLAANGATPDTPLYVGDELCIPEGATAPAPAPVTTGAPEPTAPPQTTSATPPTAAPTSAPAPVVTTVPPTAPATTSPGPALSTAEVEALIREIWPDDLEERAVAIAKRESGLRPGVNNWCCYGVFAIYFEMGKSWLADLGVTSAAQLWDARTNVQAAYHLYTRSGWGPWSYTDPGS